MDGEEYADEMEYMFRKMMEPDHLDRDERDSSDEILQTINFADVTLDEYDFDEEMEKYYSGADGASEEMKSAVSLAADEKKSDGSIISMDPETAKFHLNNFTVLKLKEFCKSRGYKKYTRLSKAKLIEFIITRGVYPSSIV